MRLFLPKRPTGGLVAFAVVLAMGVFAPVLVQAQSKSEAQLTVRVQELEDQVRTLTGQIEGLQFQLTQMQTLIQKQNDDNEFRFQQLEGGDGKKSDAATQTGGATPTGALPQAQPGEQTTPEGAGAAPTTAPASDVAPDAPVISDEPMDDLGDSQDPLLNGGPSTLGTAPEANGDALNGGRPLNLSNDPSAALSDGDAEAQYQAGYDAIVRGDYAFAEEQFRQFIALYPKDPKAPDATNWLGEALLQRQAYDEAADVLLTGFQNFQQSPRAADLLLKLGIALAGAGEQETACRTFLEVSKRYPQQPPAFATRLSEEKQKAQCA